MTLPEWYDEAAAARASAGSDVFVVSKVHARHHGSATAARQAILSLQLFDGALDAFLLHHPVCWLPMCDPAAVEGTWLDSWRVLEEFYTNGKFKAIGVCNVGVHELRQLLATATVKPHIVQVANLLTALSLPGQH